MTPTATVDLAPFPHLSAFLDRLGRAAPLQRRAIDARLHEYQASFFQDADRFFSEFSRLLDSTGTPLDHAVASYISICKETFGEQIKFARTGRYSAANIVEAHQSIQSYEAMTRYMLGLAVTQFLWLQHYETLQFFRAFLTERPISGRYLEIGPGHGLYTLEALQSSQNASFDAVDISQASADIAKGVVSFLSPRGKDVTFYVQDIFTWAPSQRYDTLVMGEVLEHVEDPKSLLVRAASFVKDDGHLFVTTCANCPAIDHVYLFSSVQEIRNLINAAGCDIEREHVSEREYGMKRRDGTAIPTAQYAAVLRKVL